MTVWAARADQVDLRGPNPHDLARSHKGCRLLIRVRGEMRPSWLAPALPLLEPVHWVMERRMLKTIKQRAEATTETKSGANCATSEPTRRDRFRDLRAGLEG